MRREIKLREHINVSNVNTKPFTSINTSSVSTVSMPRLHSNALFTGSKSTLRFFNNYPLSGAKLNSSEAARTQTDLKARRLLWQKRVLCIVARLPLCQLTI